MMKYLTLAASALLVFAASAEQQPIEKFIYAGPYALQTPVMLDSTDCNVKAYDAKSLLDAPTSLDAVKAGSEWSGEELPGSPSGSRYALHELGFSLDTRSYAKLKLNMDKAPANYKLFMDGKPANAGELSMEPGSHHFVLKYLSDAKADKKDSLKVSFEADSLSRSSVSLAESGQQDLYTIQRMMKAHLCYRVAVSPKGDYLLITEYQRAPKQSQYSYYLQERATGKRIQLNQFVGWMPRTNRYYMTRKGDKGRELFTVDPATGAEEILSENLPEGSYSFAPTEDFLIMDIRQEGAKEKNPDVFEVVDPEDRQPGYRDRQNLAIYDLKSGSLRPLTFGYSRQWLCDISQDGRYALVGKFSDCFDPLGEETPRERPVRPHEWTSVYRIDLQTLAVDTLVKNDGFVSGGIFSPDGNRVLFQGTPEAFGRIGCTLPEKVIPSAYDYQAFILDIPTKEVHAVTKSFDPSISTLSWNPSDGMIYFSAENRDSCSLYRLDPKTEQISMLPLPEEYLKGFDTASHGSILAFWGQSAMNSDRIYTMDLSKLKADKKSGKLACTATLVEDLSARNIEGIQVADCHAWTFRNSNGDDVLCRYYLPVGFDPDQATGSEKFPMITYYYGGCSPTGRNFESSYPWQCWAAQGYAVLVVQPSGAAGFGQEWASRHVNTAGKDPARDIFEAVREFCRTHAYINKDKVGCCGASYGGFMTQYMQTLPNCPFACAISHAGISDHTTYWGYGYWGYSYSEVSMADSYPWSETDLYVKNSPIYNVDKIHTPILFLHGTKDVNVPINNSIQMFTALKLLGRETAFVCVEGEDHGVVEYDKRMEWLKTSLAWFQKYLKDDPTWWNAMYPKKNL